jgi:arylsulfatase A-like enzyme
MRTLSQQPAAKEKGLINYEVVPPPNVKMVSQILRENGYYCTNNKKEDYQFYKSVLAWDESSIFAHWRNRPKDSKFFSVFNFGVTHESNLWDPWYRQFDLDPFPPDRNVGKWWEKFSGTEKPLYVSENIDLNIPPYLPDNSTVRNDMMRMYSNIVEMDEKVGLIIDQLEEDGLLEETIIVFYTDHGGPLPRQKRLLYDSGIKVPMIIRYPNKVRAGQIDERMISFVDFAPTLLSMVKIEPPDYYHGFPFEGIFKSKNDREYIHAAADRFDEYYDQIRAVRDKQYKYLRNYNTDKPYYLPLEYRERMNSMQELLLLEKEGKLNGNQMQWFRKSKPEEELFDTFSDPHELRNLAKEPNFEKKLIELRKECDRWIQNTNDKGFMLETDLIETFWPNKKQPKTADPMITIIDGMLHVTCETDGAGIGYKYRPSDIQPHIGWRTYTKPFKVYGNQEVELISHRIGFLPSQIKKYKNEI